MLLKAYLAIRYLYEDIGIGYGCLLLLGIMAKTVIVAAHWRHQITFIAIMLIMAAVSVLYLYLRKRYYENERETPEFKMWVISLKSGFWSLISYYILLFVVLKVDKSF